MFLTPSRKHLGGDQPRVNRKCDINIPFASASAKMPPVLVPTIQSNISVIFFPDNFSILSRSMSVTSPLMPPPSKHSTASLCICWPGCRGPVDARVRANPTLVLPNDVDCFSSVLDIILGVDILIAFDIILGLQHILALAFRATCLVPRERFRGGSSSPEDEQTTECSFGPAHSLSDSGGSP